MTREIKFRAWDGERIVYHFRILSSNGDISSFDGKSNIQRDWSPMQFTGLKDKKGNEIYEGDIIQYVGRTTQKGDVYFDRGRFWVTNFYVPFFDEPSDAFGEGLALIEIIGNIYENPSLLKQE